MSAPKPENVIAAFRRLHPPDAERVIVKMLSEFLTKHPETLGAVAEAVNGLDIPRPVDPKRAHLQTENGRYYGYPECCIREFCNRGTQELSEAVQKATDSIGCGFVPCEHHAAEINAGRATLESILVNRKCPDSIAREGYPRYMVSLQINRATSIVFAQLEDEYPAWKFCEYINFKSTLRHAMFDGMHAEYHRMSDEEVDSALEFGSGGGEFFDMVDAAGLLTFRLERGPDDVGTSFDQWLAKRIAQGLAHPPDGDGSHPGVS
jgi:hypothetical protein